MNMESHDNVRAKHRRVQLLHLLLQIKDIAKFD